MEKTAKVYIMGAAAVLVSGVKLEDWKLVERYAPEALKIVDDNGEPVFRIAVGDGGGSVNKDGICWGTHASEEGYATVTVILDEEVEDRKEAVSSVMGSALLELIDMEKEMPGLLEQIHAQQERIESLIEAM